MDMTRLDLAVTTGIQMALNLNVQPSVPRMINISTLAQEETAVPIPVPGALITMSATLGTNPK